MTAPSPFSTANPKLQRAWDATSLKELMTCARKYQLSILEGWRTPEDNVHLEFGGLCAKSFEDYKKARLTGLSRAEATVLTLRNLLLATWDPSDGSSAQRGPWGGRYELMWRCTGEQPYKNSKGNRAKCPWSHKGNWYPGPSPDICGECSSVVEASRQWIGTDRYKDRCTLIRLVCWYCDEQPEQLEDGPFPYAFPDGTPAVELSFQFPLPWRTPVTPGARGYAVPGEPYILCGHLDSIMQYATERFISDNKTTTHALGQAYFAGFGPHVQVDTYDLAGNILYPDLNLRGVAIEGAQTLLGGARFGLGFQYRSDALREEFLYDLEYWIRQAERFADDNYWPMNRASCYLCQFKPICTKDPDKRQMYLESNFVRRPWNPLEER